MEARWQERLWSRAQRQLPSHVYRYFMAGAREEVSAHAAREAWGEVRFAPHVLRDVSEPDLSTTLLGAGYSTPIGVAPTALQRLAHPEGELAMARACAAHDSLMVLSSNAGTPFQEIAATGVRWWIQAYLTQDRSLVEEPLRAAAAAGAGAVVLTADTPFPGPKYGLDAEAFGDLRGMDNVNHADPRRETPGGKHATDLTPADIGWLADLTSLPVVVKGVLRPDDARRCVAAGAKAVWVSNHGGRQLDRSVSTTQALEAVVTAVPPTAEVYVDGGIRSGLDALAALATGARAVFCGRLPLLALVDGEPGVGAALQRLDEELGEGLQLAGCRTPAEAPGVLHHG